MKKNSTKDSRRIKMAIIAVIIILAMVISLVVPIFAATAKAVRYYDTAVAVETDSADGEANETKIEDEDKAVSNDALEINVQAGFDGAYMIYRQTPVKVTVYNMGDDFKGSVEVKVFASINTTYSPTTYIKYEQDAEIASGGAGEYDFIVYPETEATYMNVRLVDESGNVTASVNAKVTPYTPEQVMTAVLTDSRATGIDYLKSLQIGDDIYNNRSGYVTNYVTFLDKDSMPDDAVVLKSFGAIIIEDFYSAALSEKQVGAITNWVENGGLLVIGTGLNADKTLNGLEDIFDFTLNGYDTALCFGGSADIADIDVPGAQTTEIQSGKELTRTLDFGEGKIIVHSFSLSADPIASMSNRVDYLSGFYRNTMPEKFSSNRVYDYYPQDDFTSVNRLPSIEKSKLMILLAILFVYIIAVGPICYLVLKKRDRRERGWVVIPCVSIIFAGIIFVISMSSYQKDALVNFTTYTDLDSANPVTQVSIGMRTPDKGDTTLTFDDKVYVRDNGYYYGYGYGSADTENSQCAYSVKTGENTTSITYFDQNAWSDNSFNTTLDNFEEDAIDAAFTVKGSSIVGTIYNNLDYDLFDVIVGFSGQYQKVGYIEAGGSLDVNIPLNAVEYQKWIDNGWQLVRQMMFGLGDGEYQASLVFRKGVSATEAYKTEQRYNIFSSMVYNNRAYDLRENEFNVTVSAFSEKRLIEGNKDINGKTANENWENLYIKDFDIDMSASDEYEIPYGYIFPEEIYLEGADDQQYWDLYYYELYTMSSDNIRCEYDLPVYGDITSISVDWSNYDAFNGEPMVYNCDTDSWENLKEASLDSNPSAYISEEGKLILMSDVYSDTYITLPKLSLKGGN